MLNPTLWSFPGTTTGDSPSKLTPNPSVASSVVFQVVLASSGTVAIKGSVDGVNSIALLATNLADGTTTNSITASGLYRVDSTGLTQVWPNASANGSGITITAQQVDG